MWKFRFVFLFAGAVCGYAGVRGILHGKTEDGILLLVMGAAALGAVALLRRFD